MSAFIFVLILVSLAQCHAQCDTQCDTGLFRGALKNQLLLPGGVGPIDTIQSVGSIDTTNLTPIYIVTSNTVPDNSIEAQQYICPGFRSVWGNLQEYTGGCSSDNTTDFTLINDPAPAGFMTFVKVRYSTFTSCEQKGEIIQIIESFVVPISTCNQFIDGDFINEVYTKTPLPQDEPSPLVIPTQLPKKVPEYSKLFARNANFFDNPRNRNAACAPDVMFWYTTGECLREFGSGTFVYTFDNFQVYNVNYYADENCSIYGTKLYFERHRQ